MNTNDLPKAFDVIRSRLVAKSDQSGGSEDDAAVLNAAIDVLEGYVHTQVRIAGALELIGATLKDMDRG